MNRQAMQHLLATGFLCLALAGCVTTPQPQFQPESLVTPLPKLTTAVQALARYPEANTPIPDDQLVKEATKNKPELQRAFAGVPIKVRHDARHVVLLVCSPDGKFAWLEDASWTMGVDRKWYLSKPPRPAEFTLDPAQRGGL